jgi:hypothetical protein
MPNEARNPAPCPAIDEYVCLRCRGGPIRVVEITEFVLELRCELCANTWSMFQRRYSTRRRQFQRMSPETERRQSGDRRKCPPVLVG